MIHYERGEEVAKSTGIINEVIKNDKSYTIYHTCDTDHVSSGSPVILYNYKVIGLHIASVDGKNFILYYNILLKKTKN